MTRRAFVGTTLSLVVGRPLRSTLEMVIGNVVDRTMMLEMCVCTVCACMKIRMCTQARDIEREQNRLLVDTLLTNFDNDVHALHAFVDEVFADAVGEFVSLQAANPHTQRRTLTRSQRIW